MNKRFMQHQSADFFVGRNQAGRTSRARIAASVLLICTVGGANAASLFGSDKADRDQSWKEIVVQLPEMPKPANLVAFQVGPTATQSFSIDTGSLTVGDDNVVRYTLVITSASGAQSISYEGIHCKTMEKKLFAFGHADGTWSRSRRIEWDPIKETMPNRHHAVLANEYFCDDGKVAGTAAKLIEKLRTGRP